MHCQSSAAISFRDDRHGLCAKLGHFEKAARFSHCGLAIQQCPFALHAPPVAGE